ncbi:MAG TPA: ECF transporter S component [Nitrososphaerales archaeon]|nr:ECF transporter S component [Nitrososphaerales archaeon]
MPSVLFFSRKELAAVVAVGVASGLVDHQVLSVLLASVTLNPWSTSLNSYLFHVTGGPLFGDFLQTWLEYGGVFAACLVRKPAAGTIALTVNGFCQVFVYGTHDPHLFYGVSGLGADVVFASFHFKRYDLPTICLAGIVSGVFWYPIVWFTHGIPLYPPLFIVSDFGVRVLGSAVGDGLIGATLALVILNLADRRWNEPLAQAFGNESSETKHADIAGVMIVGLGVVVMGLTYVFPSVSDFFFSVGPKIPLGIPQSEEYNLGYIIGLLLVFLALTVLAFRRIDFTAKSGDNE